MQADTIRQTLAMIFISLSEATALATGKPIGSLSGHLMRGMAEHAPPETAKLCLFLADCADAADVTAH